MTPQRHSSQQALLVLVLALSATAALAIAEFLVARLRPPSQGALARATSSIQAAPTLPPQSDTAASSVTETWPASTSPVSWPPTEASAPQQTQSAASTLIAHKRGVYPTYQAQSRTPVTPNRAPTGIYDAPQYKAWLGAKEGFDVTNAWVEYGSGYDLTVYAGANHADGLGGVVVQQELPDRLFEKGYFPAINDGALTITGWQYARLSLVSAHGTAYYFDIPAMRFVASLTEIVSSATPLPTYSPTPPLPTPNFSTPTLAPPFTPTPLPVQGGYPGLAQTVIPTGALPPTGYPNPPPTLAVTIYPPPPPGPSNTPNFSGVPHRPAGAGIIIWENGSFPSGGWKIALYNVWFEVTAGIQVYAGNASDPMQGAVAVLVPGEAIDQPEVYLTPSRAGGVQVVDAVGERPVLQSITTGARFYFDLPTRRFVDGFTVTSAAPTVTPVSTVTPISPPATPAARLSLAALQNAAYHSDDEGDFRLTSGIHFWPPLGFASPKDFFTRLEDPVLYGDLNTDGLEDAAVILRTRMGGTGAFAELAAVLNEQGQPFNVATVRLGDRVIVQSGSIQKGEIVLNMLVQGPNEGLCCSRQTAIGVFRLQDGRLVRLL